MSNVLVIGGGPGGSLTAMLLARAGIDVTLLERETFPRYHVGESLTSSCRVMMDIAGVLEKVDAAGFTSRRGALLRWGAEDWTIDWAELFGPDVRGWQVERAEFDELLLRHAQEQGVEVVEGAHVKKVVFDGDRPVAAEWVDTKHGNAQRVSEFDFLVDASGRSGVLAAQHFRNRRAHEIFRNVAIWGYWDGGELLKGTPPGGLNVVSTPDGWFWVIPLRDEKFSVGFVTHKNRFGERRKEFASDDEMLLSLVQESETVRGQLAGAEFTGPTRVEQDYSYVADSFCGPGYFLVGDAACFLDPLLSTGVHLAMYSAVLAAASVIGADSEQISEREAMGFYESLFRNAYARLIVLVSGVYEQYKGTESYFWLAQRLVREKERYDRPNGAFAEISAGLSDLRDAADPRGTNAMPELIEEAEQARQRADEKAPEGQTANLNALRIEPSDLYDEASGLYLVTHPVLGVKRARPADAPAGDRAEAGR
ncbi:NAD(P)/FAD-dependent oxidoreductase [Streptomyces sp. NBC_00859]|uniref:NAD(P)/FAD-dependent oxidoreductase n=1 Tax=Streptomyces sp. NBC_00859 TaxID=2903682 RepID=UPI0038661DD4|nr:tryptophan 7-halogenase [Streptomyces sp. NBC_00859]